MARTRIKCKFLAIPAFSSPWAMAPVHIPGFSSVSGVVCIVHSRSCVCSLMGSWGHGTSLECTATSRQVWKQALSSSNNTYPLTVHPRFLTNQHACRYTRPGRPATVQTACNRISSGRKQVFTPGTWFNFNFIHTPECLWA